MLWTNAQPTSFTLGSGNSMNYVYGEFRTVHNGQAAPSLPDTETITLNALGPVVGFGVPNGILDSTTGNPVQIQYIDSSATRPIVFAAASLTGESVTLNISACTTASGCPSSPNVKSGYPTGIFSPSANDFVYNWYPPDTASYHTTSYLSVEAVDAAGNTATNHVPGGGNTALLTFFTPPTSSNDLSTLLTCNIPGTSPMLGTNPGPCYILDNAGGTDTDIPTDQVWPASKDCPGGSDPNAQYAFQGYSDPSMRRDSLPGDNTWLNVWGTNLYMIYSYSRLWTTTQSTTEACSITPAVETHLAGSNTSTGYLAGANWTAWCGTANCPIDSVATPIWPTEPYCGGNPSVTSINGQPCSAACSNPNIQWPPPPNYETLETCFSSHEVPDIWPVLNYPSTGDETWFAAHLMYWVPQGGNIEETALADGCLVVSVASTPTLLGWSGGSSSPPPGTPGQGPAECPATGAQVGPTSNNAALNFADLTTAAQAATLGLTCSSWGSPAIIVFNGTLYLAANCLYLVPLTSKPEIVTNKGYYIFQAALPTGSSAPTAGQLSLALVNASSPVYGPYTPSSLPGWPNLPFTPTPPGAPGGAQPVNSITELKFALAADGQTIIAVVTPEYSPDQVPGDSVMSLQYGCMATTFSLTSTSGFGNFLAFVTDMATIADSGPDNGSSEMEGPNGCAYEPTSNTGMAIVRHTLGPYSTNTNIAQNQFFYIVPTGVFP